MHYFIYADENYCVFVEPAKDGCEFKSASLEKEIIRFPFLVVMRM